MYSLLHSGRSKGANDRHNANTTLDCPTLRKLFYSHCKNERNKNFLTSSKLSLYISVHTQLTYKHGCVSHRIHLEFE